MYMGNCLSSKLTTILFSVSPCDLWIVLAAAALSGNCFLTICTDFVLPTANCAVIGLIGVREHPIPSMHNCLLSCLVFSPTSAWLNCTHMIPDGLSVCCTYINFMTLPAPLVIPSSVLVLREISVLSPTAKCNTECNCFVFLGSPGTCFNILSLSSCESAPITLSCALIEHIVAGRALWALMLRSFTLAFWMNKWSAS